MDNENAIRIAKVERGHRMKRRYNRIDKVVCKNGYSTFLLTDENSYKMGLEVDMISDFWFNELGVVERETIKNISKLSEVVDFCNERKISFNSCDYERLENNTLKVGGEADMLVNEKLECDWMENIT